MLILWGPPKWGGPGPRPTRPTLKSIPGQERSILALSQCCRDKDLSLQSIISLPEATFRVFSQQLESVNNTGRHNKDKRDISFLSKVFGDGAEIIKIENTLSAAIENFNENFKRVETFDDQVQNSIHLLDDEIFGLMKNEEQLRSRLTELHLEMRSYQTSTDYIMVKHQILYGLENMMKRSALADQVEHG